MERKFKALNFLKVEKIDAPFVAMLSDWGITQSQLSTFMKKQKKDETNIKFSNLSLGMFNAVLETGKPLSIAKLRQRVIDDGLPSNVSSFTTRYGQFKAADIIVQNKQKWVSGNVPNSKLFRADIKLKFQRDGFTKEASISIYSNGKIRFSGGSIRGDEHKFIMQWLKNKNWVDGIDETKVVVNNIVGKFKIDREIDPSLIHTIWDFPGLTKFVPLCDDGQSLFMLNGFVMSGYMNNKQLFIEFCNLDTDTTFNLIINESGIFQIQGVGDIGLAFDRVKDFIRALGRNNMLNNTKNINVVIPQQTSTKCPKVRRPVPYSFDGKCPPSHPTTKANPQGQPCCYKGKAKAEFAVKKCMRMTKPELLKMASEYKLKTDKKMTKAILCDMLVAKLKK